MIKDKIKHIVLSGGGPSGFLTYGALRYLEENAFWKLAEIESIYSCSVGAYFGVIISLGYDWHWLDDYFIQRPWEKLINLSALTFFEKKGLLDETFIEESISLLFSAKGLNVNITLKELYEYNKIDIHLYATNVNTTKLEKVDLSHQTHPNLSVIKALNMSMCFPFLFRPVCINDTECYIDGGLMNNYPLNDCILQKKCNTDEIMAFKNVWINNNANTKYTITKESSVIDFLVVLLRKMQCSIDTEQNQEVVKNTIICQIENLEGMPQWINALSNEEMRKELIEQGSAQAKIFLSSKI